MSPAQLKKYRVTWSKCRAALKAAGKAHDDAARYELHRRAIGRACSSQELSNREFDQVLAAMMAIVAPADFGAQMRQQDQEDLRREDVRNRTDDALRVIIPDTAGNDAAHVHFKRRRYEEGLTQRMFNAHPAHLTERQSQQVMGVVEQRARTIEQRARAAAIARGEASDRAENAPF